MRTWGERAGWALMVALLAIIAWWALADTLDGLGPRRAQLGSEAVRALRRIQRGAAASLAIAFAGLACLTVSVARTSSVASGAEGNTGRGSAWLGAAVWLLTLSGPGWLWSHRGWWYQSTHVSPADRLHVPIDFALEILGGIIITVAAFGLALAWRRPHRSVRPWLLLACAGAAGLVGARGYLLISLELSGEIAGWDPEYFLLAAPDLAIPIAIGTVCTAALIRSPRTGPAGVLSSSVE